MKSLSQHIQEGLNDVQESVLDKVIGNKTSSTYTTNGKEDELTESNEGE
ncbi:hypothetical protein NAT51_09255 [Flavobacterium amniphilum]|nr:hypothetical protein [Flavobacterium amniphilum]MCL9805709.1 hypothetical protein [Flavobacterium amniphilum]